MTSEIPTTEPNTIQAGDTVKWNISLAEYPASAGWALEYRLTNRYANYNITSTPDGDTHTVVIPATTTATYQPGGYQLIGWVTKDAERYSVVSKAVIVKPDLATVEHFDNRTPARAALDDLNEGLRKYAGNAWKQSYTIEGRTMTFRSAADYFTLRSRLQTEVNREVQAERLAQGLGSASRIRVRV